jgi:hypothetical protein
MVFLLAFYIINDRIHMTVANAKCTITLLPVVEYLRHIGVYLGQMRFGYGFGSALGREY